MAKIFIHIGYPKCLSTTIQRSYFEKHPAINYCGVGINDNISYVNPDIEFIFEVLLKYSRKDFFEMHFNHARKELQSVLDTQRPNVFSSEHLVMNFTLQGLDPQEKLLRMQQLFKGHDVEIIVIHREREQLIRSLYGEMVRMGYYGTYDEFLLWIEKFKDRNFYYDLDLGVVEERTKKIFSKVHILSFEELVPNASTKINKRFSEILNVPDICLPIDNNNPSLSLREIEALRKYNIVHRRELGESALTPFEHHRNRTLFTKIGIKLEESEVFANVIHKREALSYLKRCSDSEFD